MIYKNKTSFSIIVNGIAFNAGQTITTERICDSTSLELISYEGSYNPVVAVNNVTFVDTTSVVEVTVDHTKVSKIKIYKIASNNISVYFNDKTNTPATPLIVGETLEIEVGGRINKLCLVGGGAGTCQVIQYK